MEITPTPAFLEACRQVLGITDLIPAPTVVIPAMRDPVLGPKIESAHASIMTSAEGQHADEQAAEMKRTLEGGLTPAEMGWPHLSPEELVASEWKCWFDEEHNVVHVGHVDPSDSSSPYRRSQGDFWQDLIDVAYLVDAEPQAYQRDMLNAFLASHPEQDPQADFERYAARRLIQVMLANLDPSRKTSC